MRNLFSSHKKTPVINIDTASIVSTSWKTARLAEISQLKRQLEAQQGITTPRSKSLILKYQHLIETREKALKDL